MEATVSRMSKRVQVLMLVADILSESSPFISKKLKTLASNPGPTEHFQKVALELLAEELKTTALEQLMLVRAQNAMFNDDEVEKAIWVIHQMNGMV
jgi:thioredoxin-like negative regulator of GroEL